MSWAKWYTQVCGTLHIIAVTCIPAWYVYALATPAEPGDGFWWIWMPLMYSWLCSSLARRILRKDK